MRLTIEVDILVDGFDAMCIADGLIHGMKTEMLNQCSPDAQAKHPPASWARILGFRMES